MGQCVPAGRKLAGVELVRSLERLAGSLRRRSAERSQQHPLASEPNQPDSIVSQFRLSLRVEVEIDGDLLDEPRVGRRSGRTLDSVGNERGQHLDLVYAGPDCDADS